VGQKWARESHFMLLGVNPHTPKSAPTLGIGVPMDFQLFIG
jgi:hypothetical protein